MRRFAFLVVTVLLASCAAKKSQEAASPPPPPSQAPPAPEADEAPATGGGAPGGEGGAPLGEKEAPKMERAAPSPTMHRRVGGDVKIGEAKVTGLDQGAVTGALGGRVDDLKRCYEKELLTSPSLAGDVDVKISIDKNGEVKASASGIGNAPLESCVAETVEKVDFGKPQGRAQVTVRITFSSES